MRKKILILVIAVSIIAAGCSSGSGENSAADKTNGTAKTKSKTGITKTKGKTAAAVVETQKISLQDFSDEYRVLGKVFPGSEVTIGANTSGIVKKIYVKVGDSVAAGDTIYTTDNESVVTDNNQRILSAKNSLTTAEIAYEDAKKEFENSKKLYGDGFISKSEYDSEVTNLENQRLKYDNALNSYNSTLSSSGRSVQNTVLYSTVDGVISEINVQEGEKSSSNDIVIVDNKSLIITTVVSGKIIDEIYLNDKVRILYEDKEYSGRIIEKSQVGINNTDSFEVKVRLEDENTQLKSGFSVNVYYAVNEMEDQIVVPKKAVLTDAYGDYIYLVKESTAVKTYVTQGITSQGKVQISGDISQEDEVIVSGQNFVTDGSPVEIKQ